MILRRLGNKKKIAKEIQKYFPPHKIYIEPFFGAGGMFFNKPKAQYNFLNDLDSDVFNLFQVVSNNQEELIRQFKTMPIHTDLLNYWKNNTEEDPIKKALRFLFLSNFCLYGKPNSLRMGAFNSKQVLLDNIDETSKMLFDVQFMNVDFRKVFKMFSLKPEEYKRAFVYCDPPYLDTDDNYSNSFTEKDSDDLFDCLLSSGCNFAMSEFDHPFILTKANKNNLNTIIVGERNNLKNRRTEILITNYENRQQSLF